MTILYCGLLKDNNRALVAKSGPEINSRACLCVLHGPRPIAKYWLSIQRFIFLLMFCLETPIKGSGPTNFWIEPSLASLSASAADLKDDWSWSFVVWGVVTVPLFVEREWWLWLTVTVVNTTAYPIVCWVSTLNRKQDANPDTSFTHGVHSFSSASVCWNMKWKSLNVSCFIVKGKVHPCTGAEALYRPYGP